MRCTACVAVGGAAEAGVLPRVEVECPPEAVDSRCRRSSKEDGLAGGGRLRCEDEYRLGNVAGAACAATRTFRLGDCVISVGGLHKSIDACIASRLG